MSIPYWVWKLVDRVPCPLSGRAWHRLGLSALSGGHHRAADRLFERAAREYRRELRIEPLARVRIHQQIGRVQAEGFRDPAGVLEVDRRLAGLRTIESLEPPFSTIDAAMLLGRWGGRAAPADRTPHLRLISS